MSERDREVQQQLEALLKRVEHVGRRMRFDDLRELARLYRLNSARLAILRSRSRGVDPSTINYLNALCVRAYTLLHVEPPRKLAVEGFFLRQLPATLAATAWMQVLVAIITVAGALIGASTVAANPANIFAIIPEGMYPPDILDRLVNSPADRAQFLTHSQVAFGLKSVFSAGLFVHNTEVGMTAFAAGILAGVPTALLDFYNGLILGAFAWIFSRDNNWPLFWAWMLPHAIPELLGVTLCSVGGLLLARAVIAPGRNGIATTLREAAGPALQLVAASVPLFLVAAGIESFLRQSMLSTAARFAAAAIALGAIVGYVWYVRWLACRPTPPDLAWLESPSPTAATVVPLA